MTNLEFADVKERVIQGNGGTDPFTDPQSWKLIESLIPPDMWHGLIDIDGNAAFAQLLPDLFPAKSILSMPDQQTCWERIGNFYKNKGRYREAISIYSLLYHQLSNAQQEVGQWANKELPLIWLGECYGFIGYPVLAKRHLMLALCEHSIKNKGVGPDESPAYGRLLI